MYNSQHQPRSSSGGSNVREQQSQNHEDEKDRIVRSCFSRVDESGHLLESYITHVKVVEDSYYPSSKPPPSSAEKNKKRRAIIVAVRKSGRVRVHKARENANGTFQIGKSWNLDELSKIEGDPTDAAAFVMHMGKPYYWVTSTPRERSVFVGSAIKIYKRYTGGTVPELVNIEYTAERQKGSSTPGTPTPTPPPGALPNQGPPHGTGSPGQMQGPPGKAPLNQGPPLAQGPPAPLGQNHYQNQSPGQGQRQAPPASIQPKQAQPPPPASSSSEKQPYPPNGPASQNQPNTQSQHNVQPKSHPYSPEIRGSHPNFSSHQRTQSSGAKTQESYQSTASAHSGNSSHKRGPSNSQVSLEETPQMRPPGNNNYSSSPVGIPPTGNQQQQPPRPPLPSQTPPLSKSAPPREAPMETRRPSIPNMQDAEQRSPSSPNILVNGGPEPQQGDGQNESGVQQQGPSSEFKKGHRKNRSSIHDIKVFARPSSIQDASQLGTGDDDLASLAKTTSQVEEDILQSLHVQPEGAAQSRELDATSSRSGEIAAAAAAATTISTIESTSATTTARSTTGGGELVNSNDISATKAEEDAADVLGELEDKSRSNTSHSRQKSKGSTSSMASRERKNLSFSAQSNASAVEETLGEFNWTGRDDSKSLEMNISNELLSIEAANTHNVVDLDDRLDEIDQILEDAIAECDRLDTILAFFSVQLGSFGDDIRHIEGQGKGIQVQTNHQKDLWNELHRILKTVSLSEDLLRTLKAGRFETIKDLSITESALVELYKALAISEAGDQHGDALGSMNAIKEKRHIYEQTRNEFGNKFKHFIDTKFKTAMQEVENTSSAGTGGPEPQIVGLESPFMRQLYPMTGIFLYLREIDDVTYESVLKMYEYCVKPYYENAISTYMAKWRRQIASVIAKSEKFTFASTKVQSEGIVSKSLKRSGTLAKFKSSESREARMAAVSQSNNSQSPNAAGDETKRWAPDHSLRSQIKDSLKAILQGISDTVIAQQEVLIQLFHQSSFGGTGFPDFVKRNPASKRKNGQDLISKRAVREIEPDVNRGKEMLMHVSLIFGSAQEDMARFVDFLAKNSSLECPSLLAMVEIQIAKFETTNQDFLVQLLRRMRDKLSSAWQAFVRNQIQMIGNTLVSSKKRSGVVYFVKVLPGFCKVIEGDLRELYTPETPIKDLTVRQIVDDSYEKIFKEVFQNLQRIAKAPVESVAGATGGAAAAAASASASAAAAHGGAGEHEDKEQLNYHIMMIENMSVLKEGLAAEDNAVLMSYRGNAMMTYKNELDLYIKMVIRRPLGRILDYLESVEAILAKNPQENPSTRSACNRASVKRMLQGFDNKELRKGTDALYRRVEKHFWGEDEVQYADKDPQLVQKVWSAIQAEYSSIFSRLIGILDKYYKDSEISGSSLLEVSKADVNAAFVRK